MVRAKQGAATAKQGKAVSGLVMVAWGAEVMVKLCQLK